MVHGWKEVRTFARHWRRALTYADVSCGGKVDVKPCACACVCVFPPLPHHQSSEEYLRSFFNALATLRIFTVMPSTRALMFDVAGSLKEVAALIILLVVRVCNHDDDSTCVHETEGRGLCALEEAQGALCARSRGGSPCRPPPSAELSVFAYV